MMEFLMKKFDHCIFYKMSMKNSKTKVVILRTTYCSDQNTYWLTLEIQIRGDSLDQLVG